MQNTVSPIEQYIIDFVLDFRTRNNVSQQEIATIIGTTQAFVAHVESPTERAKYNINHVNMIADYFGLSPKDFMPTMAFSMRKFKSIE